MGEMMRNKRRSVFNSPFCLTKKLQYLKEIKRAQELICSQPLAPTEELVKEDTVVKKVAQLPSKRRRITKHDDYIEYLVENSEVLKKEQTSPEVAPQ